MTAPRSRPRSTLISLLTVLALLATFPAMALAADGWPMAGQGLDNASRAVANGPSDPGVRWAVDLEEDTTLSFATGELAAPILHPDGVLVRTASAGAGEPRIVGIDATDGSVLWQLDDVADRCKPVVDSSDRLWVLRSPDADASEDLRFVQQVNATTGAPVAGTSFSLGTAGIAEAVNDLWCWGSSLQIAGSGANERLLVLGQDVNGRSNSHVAAIDVSGATPSLAWAIDADDADYDRILAEVPGNLQDIPQARVGASTATHWYVPVQIGDAPALARISLADGSLASSAAIPVLDDDGDAVAASTPWSARTLISGGQVVVSLRHIFGFGDRSVRTMVHSFDASDLSLTWSRDVPRRNTTATPGATLLVSTGSTIIHSANTGTLQALDAATGTPRAWSGSVPLREIGASATPQAVADAGGNLYVFTDRELGSFVRLSAAGAQQWEVGNNTLELETGIAPGTDAQVAAIDADGVLYLYNTGRMYAIDSSGDLAECVLPFTDVAETNTHAVNICRLVQAGITSGVTPTIYNPTGDVSRAQMASFLASALGLDPINDPPPALRFPDVDGSIHAGNIHAIRQAGVTQGRGDGTYDPSGSVTRAEMATFLANAAGLSPVEGTGFADVSPTNVHAGSIYAVRDAGITSGVTATAFRPDQRVRRDQMASFLMNLVDYLEEQDAS